LRRSRVPRVFRASSKLFNQGSSSGKYSAIVGAWASGGDNGAVWRKGCGSYRRRFTKPSCGVASKAQKHRSDLVTTRLERSDTIRWLLSGFPPSPLGEKISDTLSRNKKKTSSLPFHLLALFRAARAASCDNRLVTAQIAGYQTPTRDEGRVERGVLLSKIGDVAMGVRVTLVASRAYSLGRSSCPPAHNHHRRPRE
jgi:hypothetical protein